MKKRNIVKNGSRGSQGDASFTVPLLISTSTAVRNHSEDVRASCKIPLIANTPTGPRVDETPFPKPSALQLCMMGTAPQNEKGREKRPCHRFAQNSCSDTEKTGASIKGGHALLSNVVGAIDRGRMVRKREVKRYTARESTLYPSSSEANISEPNAHMNIVRPKYESMVRWRVERSWWSADPPGKSSPAP